MALGLTGDHGSADGQNSREDRDTTHGDLLEDNRVRTCQRLVAEAPQWLR